MKSFEIVIIDYDMGNVGSIANMIKKVGGISKVTRDRKIISKAKKMILPGVGAFDNGMSNLKKFGLLNLLNKKALKEKIPVLGVCLGMQLLTDNSEEGRLSGLSWVKARTVKFSFSKKGLDLRIPHMGWNTVEQIRKNDLLTNILPHPRFYFVHSYHVVCNNKNDVIALTNYGYDFASMINHGNIYGVQFHPEKSHKFGMKIYSNFLNL